MKEQVQMNEKELEKTIPQRPPMVVNTSEKTQLTDDKINVLKQFVALLKVVN
jgi:hypothetical protein